VVRLEEERLWPTATTDRATYASRRGVVTDTLPGAVVKEEVLTTERAQLWPTATATATATDAKASGAAGYSTESGRHSGTTLTDAVVRTGLYPSPSASSYGSSRGGAKGRVGPVRESLESMARHENWATPQSRDEKGPTGRAGRLENGGRRVSLSDQDAGRDGGPSESKMGPDAHGVSFDVVRHPFPAGRGQAQYDWEPPRTIPSDVKLADRPAMLKACGNVVVPQCSLVVGRVVVELGAPW
jgi:hypothetical protein